jgi:hypothetical protein
VGVSLFAMYDPEVSGPAAFASNPDGRTVAAAAPQLDEIAAAKGLPPFTRFAPDLDEFLDADPPAGEPPEMWFDPADGTATLPVLIEALRTEPGWSAGRPDGWAEEVAGCLERLRQDLEAAGRAGARFSLAYM